MNQLINKMDTMDGLFNQLRQIGAISQNPSNCSLSPKVDIYESERAFILEAELPGVKKEDLNVEIEANELKIHATRKIEGKSDAKALRSERYAQTSFERHFRLGETLSSEGISGELIDGILTLEIPKSEKNLPRRIEVK